MSDDVRSLKAVALALLAMESPEGVTVERLDVGEPGRTFRLSLFNGRRAPLHVFEGRTVDLTPGKGRPGCGLMYANEEGTECGGLLADKQVALTTMDHYNQQEVCRLASGLRKSQRWRSLAVYDQGPPELMRKVIRRIVSLRRLGLLGQLLLMPTVIREHRNGRWFNQRAELRGVGANVLLVLAAAGRKPMRATFAIDRQGPRLELRGSGKRKVVWKQ